VMSVRGKRAQRNMNRKRKNSKNLHNRWHDSYWCYWKIRCEIITKSKQWIFIFENLWNSLRSLTSESYIIKLTSQDLYEYWILLLMQMLIHLKLNTIQTSFLSSNVGQTF
jgi:hypothetical protein